MLQNEILHLGNNVLSPRMAGDVGYDLVLSAPVRLARCGEAGSFARAETGVSVALPEGVWAQICGRSSANARAVLVMPAVIDNGYRGELFVIMVNLSPYEQVFEPGQRVAQLILHDSHTPPMRRVEELPPSERGASGFGSTGGA